MEPLIASLERQLQPAQMYNVYIIVTRIDLFQQNTSVQQTQQKFLSRTINEP